MAGSFREVFGIGLGSVRVPHRYRCDKICQVRRGFGKGAQDESPGENQAGDQGGCWNPSFSFMASRSGND
jgi:hypothetical protein